MSNLQNLIERIVEAKVKTLLNEGNKANKQIKNKAIAAKGREIIDRGEFSGFEGDPSSELKTGRLFKKLPYIPKIPKSFIDRRTGKIDPHTVRSSKRIETGQYSDPHLGKHRINRRKEVPPTVHGPKGKLP